MKNLMLLILIVLLLSPALIYAVEETETTSQDSSETAPPDSSLFPELMENEVLNAIALKEIVGGHLVSSEQEIVDGIVYQRVVMESRTEKVRVWLDPYTGKVKRTFREEKEVPEPDLEAKTGDEQADEPDDIINRDQAQKIARWRHGEDTDILRTKRITHSGQTYYEVKVRKDRIGAEEQRYWINTKTARLSLPDDDPNKAMREAHQKSLAERQGHKIKITPEDAEKKALEKVPGTVIVTQLDKKLGDMYYMVTILSEDQEIRKVRIHASRGDTRVYDPEPDRWWE